MDPTTPQERPNYMLHYKAEFRDDWINSDYRFNAPDDNTAREIVLSFVNEHNRKDGEEIDAQKKSWQDWCHYKPLKLERLVYVMKEVEERTPISLQGDVASRARSGAPIELSELVNL